MSDLLDVFGNAIWIAVAATSLYLGLKSDMRSNAESRQHMIDSLKDHETRIRRLEHRQWKEGD